MLYMLVRHSVADFTEWHRIFASHAEAQRKAGLHLLHLLRDAADPNVVVVLFRVADLSKAKAFTETRDAREAAQESGVIGVPEVSFLNG